MNPSRAAKALRLFFSIKQPVFLWGAPGVGKSQLVAQAADELGLPVTDIRAVLLDPVDLRGIPHIGQNGATSWAPPEFLPRDGAGVLFLDELNAAPPLVQAACYQLILDRRLGEYELPPGWTVAAAGNRESDRAVTHRMPSALANRLAHIDCEPDIADWLAWAQESGIDPRLRAFLRFRPKLLHDFDPMKNEKAFPSPRSWEYAARILSGRPEPGLLYDLLRAVVGEIAASECAGFLSLCDRLPDPDRALADPEGVSIPEDPAAAYAMCEAVAQRATVEGMDNLAILASRLPAEFGALLMRDAAAVEPGILDTGAFQTWACANSGVLV